MKYKVGNKVSCKIEVLKNGKKKFLFATPLKDSKIEEKSFYIIAIDNMMSTYKLLIDEDIVGWKISKFHVKFQGVSEKFLNKSFYDITENLILEKK